MTKMGDVKGEKEEEGKMVGQVSSQKKGNSKMSPGKGKSLVKGGGKKSSSFQEQKLSPSSNQSSPRDLILNPVLRQPNLLASLKDAFAESKDLELAEEKRALKVQVTHEPFSVARLFHFLQGTDVDEEGFCAKLTDELLRLKFIKKNNDLYQFHQTKDLLAVESSPKQPYLNAFKAILRGQVKPLLQEITGISLNDDIDLFCGQYATTDYLLCHDDELEGRRIAFIFYLVSPHWTSSDGGALDLFSTNSEGLPNSVVKSLLPTNNSFAFFPVGEKSFHQVAEVTSKDKTRLSLSGWFHGDSPAARPARCPARLPKKMPWIPSSSSSSSSSIAEWVSPMFFDASLAKTIRRKFGKKSEIQLENFIRPEKIGSLREELGGRRRRWRQTGPANHSRYFLNAPSATATPSPSPSPASEIEKLRDVFRSEEMFFLLSHLTGLRIHPDVDDDDDDEEEEEEDDDSDSDGEAEGEDEDEDREENDDDAGGRRGASAAAGIDEEEEEEDPPVKKMKMISSSNENSVESESISTRASLENEDEEEEAEEEEEEDQNVGADIADVPADASFDAESDSSNPGCSVEIRRWQPGCYTLLGDLSASSSSSPRASAASSSLRQLLSTSELDVTLTVFPACDYAADLRWDSRLHGGATVYVAKDEEDELLTVAPKDNGLSLVFREKDTSAFVKYVNSQAPGKFFQITCGYQEVEAEMEGVREEEEEEEVEEEEEGEEGT